MNKTLFSLVVLISTCFSFSAQPWPPYKVSVCENGPKGYYFFQALKVTGTGPATHPTQMILDGKGRLVYFKTFAPGEWSGDFKLQPNGLMSYNNDSKRKAYLMNKDFTIVDSVSPKNGLTWDFHEFQVLANGHFVFFATETSTVNLSAHHIFNKKKEAGSDSAILMSWVVQELDEKKNVVFEWHSKNHYDIKDVDDSYLSDSKNVDIVHFNSVDYKEDYFLVSARNYNEVTKVSKKDGSVIWRLGGKRNQFKF
jgi:hypothetical protein